MEPNNFYHIYNRGNNGQTVFFKQQHYHYFYQKMLRYMLPSVYVLAHCQMPNHFHQLVYTKENYDEQRFKRNFGTMLSSYTRGVNRELNRSGSLFQQHSKFKNLETNDEFYPLICFNYIHQNPIRAGLVDKLEKWKHSSYLAYAINKKNPLIDKIVANQLLEIPKKAEEFIKLSKNILPEYSLIKK